MNKTILMRRGNTPARIGGRPEWGILCDFDGTISLGDVTDALLSRFGRPGCDELETAWLAGEIGSRDCMRGQIALLDASLNEVNAVLDSIAIDPAFVEFAAVARQHGVPLQVVSDGLDYAIGRILSRHGLHDLPVFANRLEQRGERGWALHFPHSNPHCRKGSGHCKCAHAAQQQRHWARTLYVGDGASDFCVSGEVDLVLAKDKLVDYCRAQGIAHYPVSGFAAALALWPALLDALDTRQTVPAAS